MSTSDGMSEFPEAARSAADDMMQRYGQPDEMSESRVIWHENGPWVETIIFREPIQHNWPREHPDLLEQSVYHNVPVEKLSDLAEFDGSVIVDRTRGTLAARCDREEMNFLALNLAHDIITDQRTVQEARDFFTQTAMEFMAIQQGEREGPLPEYTQGLLFEPDSKENAAEPGEPAPAMRGGR